MRFDRTLDRRGKLLVVGQEYRLCAFVMLGLRQQIRGNPFGVGAAIGEDHHLRRSGNHVDTDFSENSTLGGRDIGVARPDDFRDRSDRSGAVSKRRNRLRSADPINLVNSAKFCRRQYRCRHDPPGAGATITRRGTPATFAGTAFIKTDDG